jgi:hypothetical protein
MVGTVQLRVITPKIPRIPGTLVYFISFFSMLLATISGTEVSVGLSILVGALAAVDHVLKIHWKLRQERERRASAKKDQVAETEKDSEDEEE